MEREKARRGDPGSRWQAARTATLLPLLLLVPLVVVVAALATSSRVRVDGNDIVLDWTRANMTAHRRLTATMRGVLKACGYPIVLAKPFDRRTPSHQCGTVRIGDDPARSALDPHCKAWDHDNLYVVDASCLPTSAAVNPALTVAALGLRAADRIRRRELGA